MDSLAELNGAFVGFIVTLIGLIVALIWGYMGLTKNARYNREISECFERFDRREKEIWKPFYELNQRNRAINQRLNQFDSGAQE
jgi:hypothetical protein